MATYEYTAVDRAGKQKKGTMEAQTEERVKDFLKSEGLIPITIKEQSILSKPEEGPSASFPTPGLAPTLDCTGV